MALNQIYIDVPLFQQLPDAMTDPVCLHELSATQIKYKVAHASTNSQWHSRCIFLSC